MKLPLLVKSGMLSGLLGTLLLSNIVMADSDNLPAVQVKWGDYKEFTDVKSANESRKRFAQRTFADLEKYIVNLASDLPKGHQLNIEVTDLDLAGRVLPASFAGLGMHSADSIRVIKQIDIPRIKFTYIYADQDGVELKRDDVNIKDMSFLSRHNPVFRSDSLKYEKNMLRSWFNETFLES